MRTMICAAALALAAQAAPALDLDKMTEAERSAFRAEVRAYLMDNPEVLVEAIQVLEQRRQTEQMMADQALVDIYRAEIFEDGFSWVGGNPDGDVTVVEFLDYKCGFCKQAHPAVVEFLRTDGNVRFIIKEFPILGPQSDLAARFAISTRRVAGGDAYAAIHDALMTFRGDISDESLRNLAAQHSLDVEAVMAGMSAPETTREIEANHRLAQALQIDGTPGFIFGDRLIRGFVPLEGMIELVEDLRG